MILTLETLESMSQHPLFACLLIQLLIAKKVPLYQARRILLLAATAMNSPIFRVGLFSTEKRLLKKYIINAFEWKDSRKKEIINRLMKKLMAKDNLRFKKLKNKIKESVRRIGGKELKKMWRRGLKLKF